MERSDFFYLREEELSGNDCLNMSISIEIGVFIL